MHFIPSFTPNDPRLIYLNIFCSVLSSIIAIESDQLKILVPMKIVSTLVFLPVLNSAVISVFNKSTSSITRLSARATLRNRLISAILGFLSFISFRDFFFSKKTHSLLLGTNTLFAGINFIYPTRYRLTYVTTSALIASGLILSTKILSHSQQVPDKALDGCRYYLIITQLALTAIKIITRQSLFTSISIIDPTRWQQWEAKQQSTGPKAQ